MVKQLRDRHVTHASDALSGKHINIGTDQKQWKQEGSHRVSSTEYNYRHRPYTVGTGGVAPSTEYQLQAQTIYSGDRRGRTEYRVPSTK